ncbi:MAG: hypothetical protein AAF720_08045 [Pseudomonadota bacterium]
MRIFDFTTEQIAAIVGSLVADELSWRFRKHMDSLTVASLAPEMILGEQGLALDEEQRLACARRASAFFGASTDILSIAPTVTIQDWSERLHDAIKHQLLGFQFTAAGRDSETQSTFHRADHIYADAAATSNLLYGRRRIISLIAPHSLIGFILTILTPNLQQIPRIDARGVSPEELNDLLSFGDALVATPSLWRFLMDQGLCAPDNAMGLYFGERMSPDLAALMRQAGFGAQREIYGSTETSLIGWRDSPGDAFRLFDVLFRDGDQIRREDPLLRKSGDRLEMRSASVMPMDIISWESARCFRLIKRRDGAVQIGGVNVFPERIADAITDHEKVSACRVTTGQQETGFQRLIAHIVLKNSLDLNESVARSIDRHCRDVLRPNERPRIYRFHEEMPADS